MTAWKPAIATLVLLAGLSSPAHAQRFGQRAGFGGSSGFGYSSGYSGYGNYGYPNYGGFGYGGYGSGFYQGYNVPQTYNNLGGLANVIRQNTGRSGSYSYGANRGVGRPRRAR